MASSLFIYAIVAALRLDFKLYIPSLPPDVSASISIGFFRALMYNGKRKWYVMKRLVPLLMLALMLSGCGLLEEALPALEEESMEARMMEGRRTLRHSNVGVETEFHSEWFTASRSKQGSGVVVARVGNDYYAVTNHHVIFDEEYESRDITVIPAAEAVPISAVLVDACMEKELALLRFEGNAESAVPIDVPARLDEPPERGELLLAAGNPKAVDGIVTFGEYLGMVHVDEVDFPVHSHSALIFTGHSGGALADVEGNLLGINTWSGEGEAGEVNMSIPLDVVVEYLEENGIDITE